MKHILKRTALCLTASAFLLCPVSVLAGAGGTDVKMADEYGMIQEGKWPKVVTFSDTAFTNQVHTSTASVLSELNGVQTKEHTFTVKAGDRVNFDLKGSHYGPVIPENESLVFWALKNSGYRCAAVRIPNDGLYLIRKGLDSYDMKVTDFGFDTDLSDLSAHVSITMNMDAEKVMSEAEIPAVPGESFSHDFPDLFTKDRKFKDSVLITAEGNAHVSPVNKENTTVYLTDRYDMTLKESDSMGFQFILDEGAKWSFSLNGTSFTPELVSYDYNIVWENYPSAAGETQVYNADALVYRTLSIVLVDSDLKERESTVVDKWLKEEEEWERRRNENQKDPDQKTNAVPLTSRKAKAIPALAGLTVLSIAAAAALSAVSSSTASVIRERNEEKKEKTDGEEKIVLNEDEDIPALLAGNNSFLTVPVVLETDSEEVPVWTAAVFTDEKQTETLPSLTAAVTGAGKDVLLALKAQEMKYDYGAVVRVTARLSDHVMTKAAHISVFSRGLHALRNEEGLTVSFRSEGEKPGTAAVRILHENEYTAIGGGMYAWQGHTAEEREDA